MDNNNNLSVRSERGLAELFDESRDTRTGNFTCFSHYFYLLFVTFPSPSHFKTSSIILNFNFRYIDMFLHRSSWNAPASFSNIVARCDPAVGAQEWRHSSGGDFGVAQIRAQCVARGGAVAYLLLRSRYLLLSFVLWVGASAFDLFMFLCSMFLLRFFAAENIRVDGVVVIEDLSIQMSQLASRSFAESGLASDSWNNSGSAEAAATRRKRRHRQPTDCATTNDIWV